MATKTQQHKLRKAYDGARKVNPKPIWRLVTARRWDDIVLLRSVVNADLVGRTFTEIGRERGVDPFDAALDLLLEEGDGLPQLMWTSRSFQDADEGPPPSRDIYLDLAMSKKGVCRHRSFAFLVTSLSLGIPTRVITNEAHAWVEVFDGRMWRRIDLGGATSVSATTGTPFCALTAAMAGRKSRIAPCVPGY